MRKAILIAIISLILVGCRQDVVYSHFESIPTTGWDADSAKVFYPTLEDSLGDYEILIHIRHTDRYAYQNLWMFVDLNADSVLLRRDTIEVQMANARGEWVSKGITQHTLPIIYLDQVSLDSGSYTVHIQQGMREEKLRGISEVGLKVVKR